MLFRSGLEACRARRFKARAEAVYRQWRDRTWLEIKQTPVEDTGKTPTDAHAEKLMHTSEEYGSWRGRLDDAQESAEMAEALYEAFKLKAEMIRTQERLLAHEAGGPFIVVAADRQTASREPQ